MPKVGLIVNQTKREALEFAQEVIAWLTERDAEVCLDIGTASLIGRDDLGADDACLAATDLILTLGGDGTILTASRIAAPSGVPILGVHMGHFGFIAEAHPDELLKNIDDLLDGRLPVEERMMVRGEVIRDEEIVYSALGLNDVVLSKGTRARLLSLHTSFSADYMATYQADGVIVATPTGSTAYALSAGGPLIEPTVQALLVVPICPHTLSARPLVIPANETVTIQVESDGGDAVLSADGAAVFPVAHGDRITVRRADHAAKMITLGPSSFYRKVRKRLLWAERLNA